MNPVSLGTSHRLHAAREHELAEQARYHAASRRLNAMFSQSQELPRSEIPKAPDTLLNGFNCLAVLGVASSQEFFTCSDLSTHSQNHCNLAIAFQVAGRWYSMTDEEATRADEA